jgi:hypothetical protein
MYYCNLLYIWLNTIKSSVDHSRIGFILDSTNHSFRYMSINYCRAAFMYFDNQYLMVNWNERLGNSFNSFWCTEFFLQDFTACWGSLVSIVSNYRLENQGSITSRGKGFSSRLCVPSSLLSSGYRGSFPRGKKGQGVIHPNLVPRSRMNRSYTSIQQCSRTAFAAIYK